MSSTDSRALIEDKLVDEQDEEARKRNRIDFKMVTFSLAGKDYGIDIMRVKEIAKFHQFTYVPNTAPFVRGVYNLRGDIISVIDLRLMFNLPAEQRREGEPENGLILRLESNMLGVIVDNIDKVVGIASDQVQPPHPIFGDINVKYISGVAEHDERLYIILDVDRIFSRDAEEQDQSRAGTAPPPPTRNPAERPAAEETAAQSPQGQARDERSMQREFVTDGLRTFAGFYVSPVNVTWFDRRLEEWRSERSSEGRNVQFGDQRDAEQFLSTFHSRHTGAFWKDEYVKAVLEVLPDIEAHVIQVWNPGCGEGHESYSLAAMLTKRYPDRQIKIWGGDKDLMKISTAPNLVFSLSDLPENWHDLVVEGKNGHTFSSGLKDSIHFEFSDVLNAAGMPKIDLVVARDLLSYHSEQNQSKILETFEETLKPGGVLMVGDNEQAPDQGAWEELTGDSLSVYRRR